MISVGTVTAVIGDDFGFAIADSILWIRNPDGEAHGFSVLAADDTTVFLLESIFGFQDFSLKFIMRAVKSGHLVLKEHKAAKWLGRDNLYSVEWLPADISLIKKLERYLRKEEL